MFTNTYLPHVGGVARSISTFTQDLRNAGHEVMIVAPTFPGHEMHDEMDAGVFRVPAIQNFNGSDFSVRIPIPFLIDEQIEAFCPDIIHSHHPYLMGDAALRSARRRNLPLIFTHHTLYEEYTHYIAENPEKMKRFAAFLATNYANLCDAVVAPSESVKNLIIERGVSVPVSEIPTGVDVSFFGNGNGNVFRKKHRIPSTSFVIGHVGRLAPEKNLDYLTRAIARTMENHANMYFLVVGEGPSQERILNILKKKAFEDRLTITGSLTGQTLVDAYHAMNLFAFASQTETQGMVLTEAMAAGVPVIALDAPGAREVIRDGRNGSLLEGSASVERFSDALAWIVGMPKDVTKWSQHARKTAQKFSRKRSADKLSELYAYVGDAVGGEKGPNARPLDPWDKFLHACRAEWELVSEKAESIFQTTSNKEDVAGINEMD
ncbi:MAG: glycosyltransferase [Deltaproteobacteria bacterium]|nr:glycosyltransferase [Deltaproteobacteria bacterium]